MTLLLALHVAVVAMLVYGITDSRLTRSLRVRVFLWAYRRAGADFHDGTWETGDRWVYPDQLPIQLGVPGAIADRPELYSDSTAAHRWDAFVHADDDPPFYAVLVICKWCTGFYVSLLWTILWAADLRGWSTLWTSPTLWLGVIAVGVVGSVAIHAAIARLGR